MKLTLRTLVFISALMLPLSVLQSCSEDETTTTKYSLNGYVQITGYRPYINGGDSTTFTISGVTHPDGKKLGMYVRTLVDSEEISRDTINRLDVNPFVKETITVAFPDTLATFVFYAVVYPEDQDVYYSTSAYVGVITVDRYVTIPEVAVMSTDPDAWVDPRDNEPYRVIKNGAAEWMGNNLYYGGTKADTLGKEYRNCPAMNPIVGKFYTWDEAMKACPDGWRLPSGDDWLALAKSIDSKSVFVKDSTFSNTGGPMMCDAYFNETKMWEFWPKVKIPSKLEDSALRAIPMGWCNRKMGDSFPGLLEYACFWTSDENPSDPTQAYYRYLYVCSNDTMLGSADKTSTAMSVRCVRN